MIIKQVFATGFGTLQQASFSFQKGLNIVYGPNEAGKSTLQFLIFALLYGLRKKTAATLIPEAERYQPWQRPETFGGSMVFQVGGRDYSVEREFSSSRGSVKLYDALTGGDLKAQFPLDPKNKELLFAQELLGLSPLAFKNLTYIGQLASRCQDELARELAGRLANLSTAGEEEISLRRALSALDLAKQDLGTLRLSSKPLGKLVEQATELERKQRELTARLKELWQQQEQLAALQRELGKLEAEQRELTAKKQAIQAGLLAQRLEEIGDLQRQLAKQQQALQDKSGPAFPPGLVELGRSLQTRTELIEKELEKKEGDLARHQAEQQALAAVVEEQEGRRAAVCAALPQAPPEYYQSLLGKKEALANEDAELAQKGLALGAGKVSLPWSTLWGAGLSFGLAFLKGSLFFLPAGVFLLVFFLLWWQRRAKARKIQEQHQVLAQRKQKLEAMQKDLVAEFELLTRLLGAPPQAGIALWQSQGEELAQNKGQLVAAQKQLTRLKQELEAKEAELAGVESERNKLLGQVAAGSWAEFWHLAVLHHQRQELERETKELQEKIGLLLAGEKLEDLKMRLAELGEPRGSVSPRDLEELSLSLAKLEEKIGERKTQSGNLLGRLEGAHLESPAVLAAKVARVQGKIQDLSMKREALEYAEQVLISCAEKLHRQFAPQLNHQVSQIFSRLTLGKYTQVKVSEALELSLVTPAGKQVAADSLSGGTLDQLYFALRLALSRLVGKEDVALPFLLDDTFVQADRERAQEGWRCLRDLAKENQIIYFTCHQEPLELAGADVKIIDLQKERKEAM